MASIILFVMGVQCLYIDSYILTPQASTALSSQLDIPPVNVDNSTTKANSEQPPVLSTQSDAIEGATNTTEENKQPFEKNAVFSGRYTVILPNWLCWSLLGASLICFLRSIPWLVPAREY
ncbi:MAG: hypothetical protein CMJ76_15960 [Planctomycetaceae bacterium]|nr:hypothetical protein [Planctomycetaceae bacterium]